MNDIVEKILSYQKEDGSWGERLNFYADKYKGTTWNLILLAELCADPSDSRIQKASEFILHYSYDKSSGGFSIAYSPQFDGGLPSKVVPCLVGNMVFSLIRLGYLEDPRVQKSIDWIVQYQRADDGEYEQPLPGKYKNHKACFSKHTCFMGAVKSLKALAEIPENKRSEQVNQKIELLAEFMLKHHIYKKSSDLTQISKPLWLRFRYPLMYQTDVLEILDIFRKLEIRDERLNDAIELVKSKQANQMWNLDSSYDNKLLVNFGKKGESSPWITEKARKILAFYS